MKNKVSAAIITHVSRKALIPRLLATLGPNTQVFTSEADLEHNDCLENSRRAWAAFDPTADYYLVCEDDAILCSQFYERLDAILTDPNQIYNLYWSNYPLMPGSVQKGYILANHHVSLPAAAICIPTKLIPEMMEFTAPLTGWMDCRIVKWAHTTGRLIYYPIPCLVDHDAQTKSLLIGSVQPHRRSPCFIDAVK